jgi:hypothetical protein
MISRMSTPLYVTQVHGRIEPSSQCVLKNKLHWSDLMIYDVNVPGMHQGFLLGARRCDATSA